MHHSRLATITCLSRVHEEKALAPLSAPIFRPSGTYSSNIHPFLHPYIRFPDSNSLKLSFYKLNANRISKPIFLTKCRKIAYFNNKLTLF